MGNRKAGLAAALIAILAIIVGIILLGNKNNSPSQINNSPTAGNIAGSRRGPSSPVSTDKVIIQNFAFSPADIQIKLGAKITWTNYDSSQHTITESDGQIGPQSPPLSHGKSYTFIFKRVGVFHYHCLINPEMKGTVAVTR